MKKCLVCELEIPLKRKGSKFCTNTCRVIAYHKKNTIEKVCPACGIGFTTSRFKISQTCSKKCGATVNHMSQRKVETWTTTKCDNCHKEFEIRKKRLARTKYNTCSSKCNGESRSKRYNPAWVHNSSSGKFKTAKSDQAEIKYDSSWELRRFKELEFDSEVKFWGRCHDKIPWEDKNGKKRLYYPDIYIEYKNGAIFVEEVKGYLSEEAVMKIEAGTEFYNKTNKNYRVVDGREFKFDNLIETNIEEYENDYGIFNRPTMESIWMNFALSLASKSTCLRLNVGAVITDQGMNRTLALGYNGDERGGKNQCESLEPGKCGCLHAEMNCIAKSREDLNGSTLFVTCSPCTGCTKMIINSGIKKVVYFKCYRSNAGIKKLKAANIEVLKFSEIQDRLLEDVC